MLIFFRSKGGGTYGWGNVVRLSVIALYFHRIGAKVIFFFEGPEKLNDLLKKNPFQIIKLKNNIEISEEKKIYRKFNKCDIFFLESLDLNLSIQKCYSSLSKKFVILDDLLDKNYCSDYLISCQDHNNIKNVTKAKNTKLLIGYKYFPFSSEIIRFSKKKVKIKKKVKSILVFLGGGEYEAAFIKILEAIKKFDFSKITLVLGSSSSKELSKILKKKIKKINLIPKTKKIGELFKSHDISLVSGGYTKLEAAILNNPCSIIQTQWHQNEITKKFCKETGCENLGHFSKLSAKTIENSISKLLLLKTRNKIIKNYKKILNTNGIDELVKSLFNEKEE